MSWGICISAYPKNSPIYPPTVPTRSSNVKARVWIFSVNLDWRYIWVISKNETFLKWKYCKIWYNNPWILLLSFSSNSIIVFYLSHRYLLLGINIFFMVNVVKLVNNFTRGIKRLNIRYKRMHSKILHLAYVRAHS